MKWIWRFGFTLLLMFTAYMGARMYIFSGDPDDSLSHQQAFNKHYKIFSLVSPPRIGFAGEQTPLHLADVQEKLDRELLVNTYWQSQTMLFLKRANRYFPIIEPILKAHGIPEDFKYLALVESGLEPVVSPAGATGIWQIMKGTGTDYGLEINKVVDERYHLEKATTFACQYLKEAYARFGSWTLAAASYNMGMNGLEQQMRRQNANNYYDLLLNAETGRYLYRLLAIKHIQENPDTYGFTFRKEDLYAPVQTIDVLIDSSIDDLTAFAADHNINYKILKAFNPWLRDTFLHPQPGKSYTIKIPAPSEKEWKPFRPQKGPVTLPMDTLTD